MTYDRAESSPVSSKGRSGLTLVECLVAMVIISIAVLGVMYAGAAGQQQAAASDTRLRAVRLGEQLLEEIESRPYTGSGAQRSSYCLDDYNGFVETPGTLKDFAGVLYDSADQVYTRSVSVSDSTQTVPDWEGAVIPGKTVTISIIDGKGGQWSLSRFIAEPISP